MGLAPDPCFLYHREGTGAAPLRFHISILGVAGGLTADRLFY